MLPVHNADQEMGSKRLSMPFQARAERNSSEAFVSFEPTLNVSTRHVHISSAGLPATPEPAFSIDRSSFVITQLT